MPKVILRRQGDGSLTCYVPKKDLEGKVASLEFNEDDRWGGRMVLEDGTALFIEPMKAPPIFPVEMRVSRG
ncbi:MAG: putative nitrogen fixation protein NifT [Magnetococcales bacterium]|nr:putative nitrogen fixation protein NifT [Magnetococcales bacterium]